MEKMFNYSDLFAQALNRIKSLRAPRANRLEVKDLQWNIVQKQALFNFGGEDFEKSVKVYKGANDISVSCLHFIIEQLFKIYDYSTENVDIDYSKDERVFSRIRFAFKDDSSSTLLLFKEIEESSLWKKKDREPQAIRELMKQNSCSKCIYIYLMFDYAYLQLVGHNDDESDPGRGYNLYSLKWFFEQYFGHEEYDLFNLAVTAYISEVNSYIGYVTIKTLIPSSLINFRKNVERTLVNYEYDSLISIKYNSFNLLEEEYKKIRTQFLNDKTLLTLLGSKDFAESLITAEWLYDSMKKAKAIDLTIIGMGYFKAVEQLLYDLICLHKNEGLTIRKDYSRKDLPPEIPLNDQNIDDKAIDITLGSMAVFVRNNAQFLFRNDLVWKSKKFVREAIFKYADLRNGYFHKDNIHAPEMIEEIRNVSFYMFFLLLGTYNLSDDNLTSLGLPQIVQNDYYRLCEYVDYHSDLLFILDLGYGEEQYAIACADLYTKIIDNKYVQYSGVYFKEIQGRTFRFTEGYLPKEIYLGKFEFERTELISAKPVKVKKIFENGRFVGPSIAEENEIGY